MKDRYDNFFDAQQDPYEYDADDENNAEEYEEDELEDEESLEEDDDESSDDEELEDEDGEEYAEEEEEEDEEYAEEDEEEEEEEEVPAAPAASSRPFGNSLNIRLDDLNRNTHRSQDSSGRPNGGSSQARPQGTDRGMVFKQVKPTPAASSGYTAPPNRPAAPIQPVRPIRDDAPVNANRENAAPIDFSPVDEEEAETPKKGFFSRLAPWKRETPHTEFEDEKVDSGENETTDEELDEDDGRPGRLRRFLAIFSRGSAEQESEEAEDGEALSDESGTKIARLGRKVSHKFSSLTSRVRGRLRTDETLDEFKEELAESEEEVQERPHGRLRRLLKAGTIGGAAAVLVFICYTGYKHMTGSGTNSDSPSAELAATEGQGNDALGGLSSRAESTDLETTPLDSITDEFAALGDKISEQADALSDKVGETIDSAAARLTSSGQDALDSLDDLLADGGTPSGNTQNGEALGAAAGAAAAAAAGIAALSEKSSGSGSGTAADDELDFGFDAAQEDSLSSSETTPAFADNRADGGLSLDQVKENLSEAGEQLKDGFKSGVEKVDNSLKKAGEKTSEFLGNAAQDLKSDMAQAGEQAQDAAQKVGDWASSTYDSAKEKVGGAAQKVGDWAGSTYDSAKDKVGDAAASVKSGLSQAESQAQDAAQKVGDWAGDSYQNAKNWTQETADRVSESLQSSSAAGAVPAAAPQPTAGSLQNSGGRTQGLSLGQQSPSEPLFLESSNRGAGTASSLGGSAGQFRSNSTAVSGGRDTLLGTAAPAAVGGSLGAAALSQGGGPGNTAQTSPLPQNGAPLQESAPANSGLSNTAQAPLPAQNSTAVPAAAPASSAPAEIQDALAQEAAAARSAAAQQAELVQGQTPAETFAAETDLSTIGFEAPRVEDGDPLSDSLSPFGGQYSLPEETVPAAQPAQQLPSANGTPADSAAPAPYNSGAQPGYVLPGNNSVGAAAPSAGYRQYRTKDGDNLIKIAEDELGDGTRWAEISKLNPNMNLRGRLDEGLVILLPPKSRGN